jgi:SAM-dependent methyltransferase
MGQILVSAQIMVTPSSVNLNADSTETSVSSQQEYTPLELDQGVGTSKICGWSARLEKCYHPALDTVSSASSHYALGSADAEHERLIRQAAWLAPYTERCFREAGIGLGQRVLDVGSGVGDVALLLAGLVGSSGEVVAVERDTRSISRARARVAEAQVLHSFSRSFGAAEQTQKWHLSFPEYFGVLVCQHHPCVLIRCLVRRNGW